MTFTMFCHLGQVEFDIDTEWTVETVYSLEKPDLRIQVGHLKHFLSTGTTEHSLHRAITVM